MLPIQTPNRPPAAPAPARATAPPLALAVRRAAWLVCVLACAGGLACSGLPFGGSGRPSGVRSPEPEPIVDPAFSGQAAFAHLEALYALGPRPVGSHALAEAHEYVAAHFLDLGAEVRRLGATRPVGPGGAEIDLHILTAEFEGERPDAILFVAALDTAPVEGIAFAGASEGASGPAVLMELARALTEGGKPPYTLQFVFPDGDRLVPGRAAGSQVLIDLMDQIDALRKLRAVIYVDSVGDRDLSIVRDGNSNRRLRRAIFAEAPRVGREAVFPKSAGFETPYSGHRLFTTEGIPAVLITDVALGAGDPPGLHWRTEADAPAICSPDSLEAVGDVLTSAVETHTTRWARLDRLRPGDESDAAGEAPPAALGAELAEAAEAAEAEEAAVEPMDGADASTGMEPMDGADASEAMEPMDGADAPTAMEPMDGADASEAVAQ